MTSRNGKISMNSIPPEILTQILLLDVTNANPGRDSIDQMTFKPHYSRVHQLSRVCKLWKATLDGSTLFWMKISSYFPPSIISQLLQQSGASRLDVTYQLNNRGVAGLHNQLTLHARRIRSLVVKADDELPAAVLERLIGASLETLHIEQSRGEYDLQPQGTVVIGAELTQLRRLTQRGAAVTLNWPTISNLTHLEVIDCSIQNIGSKDWHILVLQNNPMLESITMSRLRRGPDINVPSLPNPIHLTRLKTLCLPSNHDAVALSVLSVLVAPVYSYIEVGLTYSSHPVHAEPPSQLNWLESGLKNLASVVLHRPHSHVSMDLAVGFNPRLTVNLDDCRVLQAGVRGRHPDPGRRPLHDLISYLCRGTTALSEVSVSSHDPRWRNILQYHADYFWELLPSTPNITMWDLKLRGPSKIVEVLMRNPPVFPKLKCIRLELTECVPEDFMVPVLRYRNAIPTLASLEELRITAIGVSSTPPAELEAMLGDGKLIWIPIDAVDDIPVYD